MFGFLAVILGPLMRLVYGIVPNYALTLIVFTVIVRVVCLPLNFNQQKSMAKQTVFQPLITEIQTKYKNNTEKQQEEMMRLQQEYGFNPTAGCLPLIVDMVVMFGIIEVVYRPVQYILGISADAIRTACEALSIPTNNTVTMQTALIQAIHNGAAQPAGLTTEQFNAIHDFNTTFLGMDMCETAGFHLSPLVVFPIIATVLMLGSNFLIQRLNGSGAQLQGGMKYSIWLMNAMFVFYCFQAPVGFSVYYGTSSICMVGRQLLTSKVYNPEKFKAQYEAELAAKKAAAKTKTKVVVRNSKGEEEVKEISKREMDRLRLDRARALEEERYADERTTPLTAEERAAQEAAAPKKKGLFS